MRRILFGAIVPLFFMACMTSIDDVTAYVRPLQSVQLGDVEKANAEKRFLDALQLSERLVRDKSPVDAEQLGALRAAAADGLIGRFRESINAENFIEAEAGYASLEALGEAARVQDWTRAKLYAALAGKLEKAGDIGSAVSYYLKSLKSATVSREQAARIIDLAIKVGDAGVLESVMQTAQAAGYNVPEAARNKVKEIIPLSTMIGGTVTIWVNKGVKIEKGSAMPDRVIGSGFFIDARGFLLTNYHVIASEVDPAYEGYSRLAVRLSDRPDRKIPARVIGWDPVLDLALLKVEVEPKFVFASTRMTPVEPGEKIRVIGSPIGLENTITSGIISATGRRFLQLGDALQLDAPINPGNSGGPVIDESGRLIGIVFAGIEQFEGINFAVSAEWINQVLGRLYRGKEVKHYWTGMALHESSDGLEVIYVVPGEPADNAGLEVGDFIKEINGVPVKTLREIQAAFGQYEAEALAVVLVRRGDSDFRALLHLAERPRLPVKRALERDMRSSLLYPLFGMKVDKVGDVRSSHFMVRRVLSGSTAEELDLSENDPVDIRNWYVDEERRIVAVDVKVQRKKLGFLEAYIRIYAFFETDNFV